MKQHHQSVVEASPVHVLCAYLPAAGMPMLLDEMHVPEDEEGLDRGEGEEEDRGDEEEDGGEGEEEEGEGDEDSQYDEVGAACSPGRDSARRCQTASSLRLSLCLLSVQCLGVEGEGWVQVASKMCAPS